MSEYRDKTNVGKLSQLNNENAIMCVNMRTLDDRSNEKSPINPFFYFPNFTIY